MHSSPIWTHSFLYFFLPFWITMHALLQNLSCKIMDGRSRKLIGAILSLNFNARRKKKRKKPVWIFCSDMYIVSATVIRSTHHHHRRLIWGRTEASWPKQTRTIISRLFIYLFLLCWSSCCCCHIPTHNNEPWLLQQYTYIWYKSRISSVNWQFSQHWM